LESKTDTLGKLVKLIKNNIMKTLYNGIKIKQTIKTNERIFMVETFDSETVLTNLKDAYKLVKSGNCKTLKHFWNFKFVPFGKQELILMYKNL